MCNDPSCGENSCDCSHTSCPCIDRTKLSNAIDLGTEGKPFCGTPSMNNNCKDSTFDGTDGACPAWWRGNDDGIRITVNIVNGLLDKFEEGNYSEAMAGCFGSEELNKLRDRLSKIRTQ